MAYTKQSLTILGIGLGMGLLVGGITTISTGILPLFLPLISLGIGTLGGIAIWNMRSR